MTGQSFLTTFRINTSKSVSKQKTLTPFRMNTYEKKGGGGPVIVNQESDKGFLFSVLRCVIQELRNLVVSGDHAVAEGLAGSAGCGAGCTASLDRVTYTASNKLAPRSTDARQ